MGIDEKLTCDGAYAVTEWKLYVIYIWIYI